MSAELSLCTSRAISGQQQLNVNYCTIIALFLLPVSYLVLLKTEFKCNATSTEYFYIKNCFCGIM